MIDGGGGNDQTVATIGHKRKIGYYFDKNNVYEDLNNQRQRLLCGDDNDGICSSTDSSSNSSRSNSDDECGERPRKARKRISPKRRLHWSKSPQKDAKYTDWKIEVKYFPTATASHSIETDDGIAKEPRATNDNNINLAYYRSKATDIVTYSIHRSTLGVQSEYFERIFLGGYAESLQQKSSIELPTPLVTLDHFESVIEFCYAGTIDLNSQNIVPIIHLSDYLGIDELQKQAQTYVQGAIYQVITNKGRRVLGSSKTKVVLYSSNESKEKSEKLAMFYQAAKVLGIEDLQRAIVHVCNKEPELLVKDCKLADMPDIEFWSRLWEARKMHPDQKCLCKTCVRLWSENLAYFFDKHPNIVDLQAFRELTHIDSLKVVSSEVAILLMQQEHRLCLDEIETNVYLLNKSDKEDSLTCLQSRCIEALYNTKTTGWQIMNPPIRGQLRKLPSIVLESILLKTMEYEKLGQRFPMPVVSGAGSDFVNGVYKMSGWFQNAMKFIRLGIHEGNLKQFTLYRYEGEWWISIIPEHHDEPGDCDDIDFYTFDSLEDTSESPLPPTIGWTTCCGKSPAPQIRLLTNDEVESYTIENPPF